jgi:hypothetical protein
MHAATRDVETFELELEDKDGRAYKGRIIGSRIDEGETDDEVDLTEDERVILYDSDKRDYWVVEEPFWEQELARWPSALGALGVVPIVDL